MKKLILLFACTAIIFSSCEEKKTVKKANDTQKLVNAYQEFELNTDTSVLSDNQKKMIPILIEVADIMEEIFWQDAVGNKAEFLD